MSTAWVFFWASMTIVVILTALTAAYDWMERRL